MADNNNLKSTVESLFQGMDGVISSKTVVGDAIHINDIIILPLVDVSFAVGAGAVSGDKKDKEAVGLGGKGYVLLGGDVAAVQSAVDAGAARAGEEGLLVRSVVIPRPSDAFYDQII